MAFDTMTLTIKGAELLAAATTQNKLIIAGCDATDVYITKEDALVVSSRPQNPMSTTTDTRLEPSTNEHVFVRAFFVAGQSAGGEARSLYLFGHNENAPSDDYVFAVLSSQSTFHLPIVGDISNTYGVLLDLIYSPAEGSVASATTSVFATYGEFEELNRRAVTTHSAHDTTTGDDQEILGTKTFKSYINSTSTNGFFQGLSSSQNSRFYISSMSNRSIPKEQYEWCGGSIDYLTANNNIRMSMRADHIVTNDSTGMRYGLETSFKKSSLYDSLSYTDNYVNRNYTDSEHTTYWMSGDVKLGAFTYPGTSTSWSDRESSKVELTTGHDSNDLTKTQIDIRTGKDSEDANTAKITLKSGYGSSSSTSYTSEISMSSLATITCDTKDFTLKAWNQTKSYSGTFKFISSTHQDNTYHNDMYSFLQIDRSSDSGYIIMAIADKNQAETAILFNAIDTTTPTSNTIHAIYPDRANDSHKVYLGTAEYKFDKVYADEFVGTITNATNATNDSNGVAITNYVKSVQSSSLWDTQIIVTKGDSTYSTIDLNTLSALTLRGKADSAGPIYNMAGGIGFFFYKGSKTTGQPGEVIPGSDLAVGGFVRDSGGNITFQRFDSLTMDGSWALLCGFNLTNTGDSTIVLAVKTSIS